MKSYLEHVQDARSRGIAIGHFNISDTVMLRAIFEAGSELSSERGEKVPLIIGTSEGEREAIGPRQVVALIRSLREEHEYPIFANADHCHDLESFKLAVDAGYDSAIIDEADEDLEVNIGVSREAVNYAREHNPGMLVEGEVGYIGSSSKLLDEIPEDAQVEGKGLVTAEIAERYVDETGVDLFAPAVGNLHGMLKNSPNPHLRIDVIQAISSAVSTPLVLHGGSGISDEDFRSAVQAGMPVVHISTELRVAYRKALEASLSADPEEVSPYRYSSGARDAVKAIVIEHLRVFGW